jgi:hypothetical protein
MKTATVCLALAAGVAVLATGCGKKKEKPVSRIEAERPVPAEAKGEAPSPRSSGTSPEQVEQAMAAMKQAMTGGKTVDPIDFRKLKDVFPESLAGLKRDKTSGEKNSAMGMSVSTAEARYGGDAEKTITLKITDMGGMQGVARMAHLGWSMAEVDRETDTGYEKTVTVAGNKGLETYDRDDKSGKVQLLVAQRFMVEARLHGVEPDAIQTLAKELPLDQLAALAK